MSDGLPAAPVLETPRLRLRLFVEADWPAYAAMCADADVMRHIGTGGPQSKEDAWRSIAMFLGHWALRGYGMYALEHRDSGTLLGRAGFHEPAVWPGSSWAGCWGESIGATAMRARPLRCCCAMPSSPCGARASSA